MTQSLALLLLRVGLGVQMAALHGWPKIEKFATLKDAFPDPLGLGSTVSLLLAIFSEFACAIAVGLGLFTKLASLPIVVTMVVAAFVHHAGDPWKGRELALVYLIGFLVIMLAGPGDHSLDSRLAVRKQKARRS